MKIWTLRIEIFAIQMWCLPQSKIIIIRMLAPVTYYEVFNFLENGIRFLAEKYRVVSIRSGKKWKKKQKSKIGKKRKEPK